MLSSTFQTILEKINKELMVDKATLTKVLEYVQTKSINSYLYSELLVENYRLDENVCLKVLILLEKYSVLKQVYKVYCPICKDFSEDIYEDINDLEEYEYCEECGCKLIEGKNPYKYVVVYFKVIKNE